MPQTGQKLTQAVQSALGEIRKINRGNDMLELNEPLRFFMYHVLISSMAPLISFRGELRRIASIRAFQLRAFQLARVTFVSSVV